LDIGRGDHTDDADRKLDPARPIGV